jgi:hypothetical protein
MTSPTPSAETAVKPMADTIPRLTARDLALALRLLRSGQPTKLECLRLCLCLDRKRSRKGVYLYSTACEAAGELRRLGLAEFKVIPKDRNQYIRLKESLLRITDLGAALSKQLQTNPGAVYDHIFRLMYREHAYLRLLVRRLERGQLFVPVITSLKDHVSSRYSATLRLATDVRAGDFALGDLLESLAHRLERELTPEETQGIERAVTSLLERAKESAVNEDSGEFSKKFLDRLNDGVLPQILASDGLSWDYRTHRTLWALGESFRVCWATTADPRRAGAVVLATARVQTTGDLEVERLDFAEHGLGAVRVGFPRRLQSAFHALQVLRGGPSVAAWELRAVFCVENGCHPQVFERLLEEEHGNPESPYRVHLDLQRSKPPRHETPVVVRGKKVGSIRVTAR